MKSVYEAASAIEAHMLMDLLKQEGLSPQLHGEHLQGAVGELPAAGLVRLLVADEEYDAARALIARWEAAQPAEPTPTPSSTPGRRGVVCFLAGLLLGAGSLYAFVRAPTSTYGTDFDRDGRLDERWTYSARGAPLKQEVDRNLDGKVDYIAYFDERGIVSTGESDDDFDGKMETRLTFRAGNFETAQTDADGDGFAELFTEFQHGVAVAMEYRNPTSGFPLRVDHFRLGRLTHAELDTDKDGRLDTRVTYSPLQEEVSREPLPR